MDVSDLEKRLRKLEEDNEKIKKQNRELKRKLQDVKRSDSIFSDQRSSKISRRGFLKKLGAGVIGLGALTAPAASKLTLSKNGVYKNGEDAFLDLSGNNGLKGDIDLDQNSILGVSGIGNEGSSILLEDDLELQDSQSIEGAKSLESDNFYTVPPSEGAQGIRDAIMRLGSGANIRLGQGTYEVTEPIVIDVDGVTLVGAGKGDNGTLLSIVGDRDISIIKSHLDPANASNRRKGCELADIALDGNKGNVTSAKDVVHGAWSRTTFENIKVENGYSKGFKHESIQNDISFEISMRNCIVKDCYGTGIEYGVKAGDSTLTNVTIDGCGGVGFDIKGWPVRLLGCHAFNCYQGVKINYARMCSIIGGDYESNVREGLLIEGKDPALNTVSNATIRGNSDSSQGSYSNIRITDSKHNIVSNSVIRGAEAPSGTSYAKYGVEETGSSDFTRITETHIGGHQTGQTSLLGSNSSIGNLW